MATTNIQTFSGDVEVAGALAVTGTLTSGTITAALSGNASTASQVNVTGRDSENALHYPTFTTTHDDGNTSLYQDSGLTYNPYTNTLAATTFSGNASSASQVNVTGRDNDGGIHYLIFTDGHGDGNRSLFHDDGFYYIPSTGVLTATTFSGNATTATTATNQSGGTVNATTGTFSGTSTTAILKSAASAATSTYNFILNGHRPGTITGGASHFINGSTRTEDGGGSTYTIRNDNGALRLGNASFNTIIEGNVGIGESNPTNKLQVSGDIYATGNVTAFSDRRAKEDIKKIENALDKIGQLSGYTYTMNDKRYTGLIAQEVLKVLPEAVTGSEETNYALAYGNMAGIMIEAIKELRKELNEVRTRIDGNPNKKIIL